MGYLRRLVPNKTAEEVAWEMPYRGAHMRASTVGELRSKGYEVDPHYDPEGGIVHALLRLPVHPDNDPPEEEWEAIWENLRAFFDPPKPNPAHDQR